jgi:predicted aldo/keto reductase-like oxidoreductase
MEFVVLPSARRHGVADESMIHALRNPVSFEAAQGDHDLEMVVGADESGRLLEVGFATTDDQIVIVHAMPARPKYLR